MTDRALRETAVREVGTMALAGIVAVVVGFSSTAACRALFGVPMDPFLNGWFACMAYIGTRDWLKKKADQ